MRTSSSSMGRVNPAHRSDLKMSLSDIKILDLIGDLYLAGRLPKAHVIAMRTGHTFHAEFVKALAAAGHLQQVPVQEPIEVMDIYEVLPHRHPMCMVDRVIEYESKKRAVGIKNVTYNEPIFEGHFPAQPVMPGVLQIESACATCRLARASGHR